MQVVKKRRLVIAPGEQLSLVLRSKQVRVRASWSRKCGGARRIAGLGGPGLCAEGSARTRARRARGAHQDGRVPVGGRQGVCACARVRTLQRRSRSPSALPPRCAEPRRPPAGAARPPAQVRAMAASDRQTMRIANARIRIARSAVQCELVFRRGNEVRCAAATEGASGAHGNRSRSLRRARARRPSPTQTPAQ
jgi:hypothetical protein